ncbi:MAG: hypothetical protein JWN76_3328 [Chitinophagaceae bacterium]|nr:hypothetical protein [Chitinophagaceae bacterium]
MIKAGIFLFVIFIVVAFAVQGSAGILPRAQANNLDTVPERAVYKDLNTGRVIQVFYNRRDMRAYNIRTKDPLQFYVNTTTGDTLYGRGELVVNGYLVKGPDGRYTWDTDKVDVREEEIKIKDGNKKIVIEDDKMKIKDTDMKMKMKVKGE